MDRPRPGPLAHPRLKPHMPWIHNGSVLEPRLRLAPLFEHSGFVHGRIGNPGCIQVDIGSGSEAGRSHVAHFRELWTRVFAGFLKTAGPGDLVVFAPEPLSSRIAYAREFAGREEGDRWQQALVLCRIARERFQAALHPPPDNRAP